MGFSFCRKCTIASAIDDFEKYFARKIVKLPVRQILNITNDFEKYFARTIVKLPIRQILNINVLWYIFVLS